MSIFSERLKELRSERNVSQKDVASAIELSLRGFQYYEADKKEPTLSKVVALAEYFDVSIDYLVGRTDNQAAHKTDYTRPLMRVSE